MTDQFGIGNAMYGMALTYFQAARGTGRTVSLVASVQSGDRIVFTNNREADRVRRLLHDAGKTDVDCIAVEPRPDCLDHLFSRGPSRGRTVFDHSWVEKWYLRAIRNTQVELQNLANDVSNRGMPPIVSERARQERQKWQE